MTYLRFQMIDQGQLELQSLPVTFGMSTEVPVPQDSFLLELMRWYPAHEQPNSSLVS